MTPVKGGLRGARIRTYLPLGVRDIGHERSPGQHSSGLD